MACIPAHQSRTRVALLLAGALTLVVAVLSSWTSADALVSQLRFRTTTTTTVEEPPEVVTTVTEPVVEQTPETTASRVRTTQRQRATTRSSARRAATPTSASSVALTTTTMATVPGSTEVPALLVPGPNNTMTGPQAASAVGGLSASAALRWVTVGLLLVGLSIAGLTVAFWRHTRPKPDEDVPPGGGQGGPETGFAPVAPDPASATPAGDGGIDGGWSPGLAGPAAASPTGPFAPAPNESPPWESSVGTGSAERPDARWRPR